MNFQQNLLKILSDKKQRIAKQLSLNLSSNTLLKHLAKEIAANMEFLQRSYSKSIMTLHTFCYFVLLKTLISQEEM